MKRDEHGDRNHQFNMDGDLIPFTPAPPAKNTPPKTREQAASEVLGADPVARMQLRMVERMVQKGLFTGEDLLYIFGGSDANTGG